MAETKEKAAKKKAPAKPKATAGTKKATTKVDGAGAKKANGGTAKKVSAYVPTHEEIAFLALLYWEQRGRSHGEHVQDWLRAEQELMKMAS